MIFKIFAHLSILFFIFSSLSYGTTKKEIIMRVQKFYKNTLDLQGDFTQESFIKSLNTTSMLNGKVYFKKGGMMLWDYQKPEPKKIISDGKALWIYSPYDGQVIVSQLEKAFNTKIPVNFLQGIGKLSEDFYSTLQKSKHERYFNMELIPKDQNTGTKKIELFIDKSNFLVEKICLYDEFGNYNCIIFENIKINQNLPKDLFLFEIPENVEIINISDLR
ncbi:MAG: outer membrane lipoprotein carrier protein LolA [Thermodesulfobacteriota bacterium]|nr:outer membrane lipoprotein carrier protein LolA [Thermodesulfobacteriota bacterium]